MRLDLFLGERGRESGFIAVEIEKVGGERQMVESYRGDSLMQPFFLVRECYVSIVTVSRLI